MYKRLFLLEWKAFFRAASFVSNLVIKIIMWLASIFMAGSFLLLGIAFFYIVEKEAGMDPLQLANQYMIYYLFADLVSKYFLQKNPVLLIKPLMPLPVPKSAIINFTLGKTLFSMFNVVHFFLLLPFSIVLIKEGYPAGQVAVWFFSLLFFIYSNNFLNILINKKDGIFYAVAVMAAAIAGLQYYGIFDITRYTGYFFQHLYQHSFWGLAPLCLLLLLYFACVAFFRKNLYLDAGFSKAVKAGRTEELSWLNQFGTLGTFLKNDIKLIRRNKRAKTVVVTSIMFLFYGLLFFAGLIETYEGPVWKIFAGIFVSGGFLFSFGQFVPSWDSAYYPLMMSQNIRYRDYLNSKWWLMVIVTIASAILSSFYLYFGLDAYLAILTGAVYNIGVNAHVVLWGGAYVKTPIDLASSKNAFGDKQSFNAKTLLVTLPKLLLPLGVYAIGHYAFNTRVGYAFVLGAGIIGFAFRNAVFRQIEQVYKKEKYKTLAAYKQKN